MFDLKGQNPVMLSEVFILSCFILSYLMFYIMVEDTVQKLQKRHCAGCDSEFCVKCLTENDDSKPAFVLCIIVSCRELISPADTDSFL